jgi:hypothetical protein
MKKIEIEKRQQLTDIHSSIDKFIRTRKKFDSCNPLSYKCDINLILDYLKKNIIIHQPNNIDKLLISEMKKNFIISKKNISLHHGKEMNIIEYLGHFVAHVVIKNGKAHQHGKINGKNATNVKGAFIHMNNIY